MTSWDNKPIYANPELRRKYLMVARRCKVLDLERLFIFTYQNHISYMMDRYRVISDLLEKLWQENIDIYDEANKTYIKQKK